MRLFIMTLSLLALTSCKPVEITRQEELPPPTEQPEPPKRNTMKITIGNTMFTATLASNTSATDFKAMLPMTLSMSDYNNNEKVAGLPSSLTTIATNPGMIQTGDIMLYGSNSIVIFYETFSTSYSYTQIGRIDNATGLKTALGKGNATIKFEQNGD